MKGRKMTKSFIGRDSAVCCPVQDRSHCSNSGAIVLAVPCTEDFPVLPAAKIKQKRHTTFTGSFNFILDLESKHSFVPQAKNSLKHLYA